jgi:hypothetical protein
MSARRRQGGSSIFGGAPLFASARVVGGCREEMDSGQGLNISMLDIIDPVIEGRKKAVTF